MAYITNEISNKIGSNITETTIKAPIQLNGILGDMEQNGTPSPSTPIDINVVTGLQKVTINDTTYPINLGKNILDATQQSYTLPANTNTYQTIYNKKPYLKANTKYYISYNIENDSTSNTRSTPRLYLNQQYIESSNTNRNTTKGRKVWEFTPTISGYYEVQYWLHTSNVDVTISDFMISTSSDIEYKSYFKPIELCAINDYQDKIYKSNGKWYIEKNYYKLTLKVSDMNNGENYPGWKQLPDLPTYFPNQNTNLSSVTSWKSNITDNVNGYGLNTNNQSVLWLQKGTFNMTQTEWKTNFPNLVMNLYLKIPAPETTEITNTELINQLNALYNAKSNNGITNIVAYGDLSAILDVNLYTNISEYNDVIYSEDDQNKAKIWFNDVEMQDFGIKCEKITLTRRIMPNNGKKVLTLSNYVASELEVILHDVNVEDLVDQVKISIGTIVGSDSLGDIYEYVPLGIFNIQNTPVINNNKVTLKLRDNRVKFDFGYNAKPLMDLHGGTATKRQVFEDICTQAGVEHEVDYFEFEDDEIGIYDDSIQAQTYISYLAEQCGKIPTTNREGKLIFVDLSDLFTWRIPLRLMPKPLTIGTPYQIQRVVYEQGVVKYESNNDELLDTLYINSSNPYIDRQQQIDYIYNQLKDFKIDTVTTQKLLGNPCIDPYDLIEVYDDSDENEPVVFRTLANQIYTFNGKHWQTFSTEIGKEQRTENVTKITDPTGFRKWASTEIDNINATVNIQTGRMDNIENTETNHYNELINEFSNYAPLTSVDTLTTQVNQIQTDTYTKTQIQEIANGTGVDGVTVTAVVSTEAQFDKDGMHYSKTDAPTNSTIDYKGFEVDDKTNKEIFYAGYDDDENSITHGTSIVRTDNINVDTYLQFGNNKGRFEEFEDADGNVGIGLFLM